MERATTVRADRPEAAADIILAAGPFSGAPVKCGNGQWVLFVPNPERHPVLAGKVRVTNASTGVNFSFVRDIDPAVSWGRPRKLDPEWLLDPYRIPRVGEHAHLDAQALQGAARGVAAGAPSGEKRTEANLSYQRRRDLDEEDRRLIAKENEMKWRRRATVNVLALTLLLRSAQKKGISAERMSGIQTALARAKRDLVAPPMFRNSSGTLGGLGI